MKTISIPALVSKHGARKAGMILIDRNLQRECGLGIGCLPDTPILMNGLDTIEEFAREGNFEAVLSMAQDTAREMLEEEGFPFGEEEL